MNCINLLELFLPEENMTNKNLPKIKFSNVLVHPVHLP